MLLLLACATCLLASTAGADTFTATLEPRAGGPIAPRTPIEIRIAPPLGPGDGRLRLLVGGTDVTDLFEAKGGVYRYRADLLPLPPGTSVLAVTRVTATGEVAVGSFALDVAGTPVADSAGRPEAPVSAEPVTFTLETGGRPFVPRDEPLLLNASRPLSAGDRVAVLLGSTDITELFRRSESGLRLTSTPVRLPSGASELVVYVVDPAGRWTEASRLSLKVLTAAGLETSELQPRLDLALNGALESHEDPEPALPTARKRFQDFTGQLNVQGRFTKSGWTFTTQLAATAVSNRQQALRFGTLAGEAPKVDLASYTIQAQKGKTAFTVGQVTLGSDKYLIKDFATRGVSATVGIGSFAEVGLAATSAVSIVGYENIVGVERKQDRMLVGHLAFELVPSAPGTVRLEATALDGQRTPQNRFQQGVVDDAEKNRGLGGRLLVGLFSQRLRLEAGTATSRFSNPPDPSLNPGGEVVPVKEDTRSARYGVLTADLLRDLKLGETARGSVSLVVRYDYVEPLFRSLGTSLQADLEQTGVELNTILGPAAIQLIAVVQKDNLNELPALLTTRSRRQDVNATLPLGALLGGSSSPSPFLPQLTYTMQRAQQVGSVDLVQGEFTPTFVPNQVSTVHTGGADWNAGPFRLGYRLTYGTNDNRQEEREAADSTNVGNAVQVGLNPSAALQLAGEVGFERQVNGDPFQVQRTRRLSGQGSWAFTKLTTFTANASWTLTEDDAGTSRNEALTVDGQLSIRLARTSKDQRHGVSGQGFLRYAWQESSTLSSFSPEESFRRQWVISSGLTLSLF